MFARTATLRPALSSRTAFFYRARPVFVAFGFALPFLQPRPVTRFDVSPGYSAEYSGSRGSKVPITTDGRTLNPAAVRQISLGSILGFGAGFLLSAFSRSLTLLLGLGIVVWQYAARKGYNIIPVERLQGYVRGIDIQSAIHDNVAFKISFGLMFALSAFGEF